MKKNISLFIVLILVLLVTVKAWLAFYVNEYVICALADILIISFGIKDFKPTSFSRSVTIFAFIASMLYVRGNLNAYIGAIVSLSPFLLFCYLRQEVRMNFLLFFNKVFAIIMTISVTCWILFLLGVQMPYTYVTYGEQYIFDNYFTFLNFHHISGLDSFFPRFCSIIIEPGDLACILVLLIFLDGYRLKKWYNIVYLISLVLTFSLAGLFLFVIGLIPHLLYSSMKNKVGVIVGVIAIALAVTYSINSSENSVAYQMLGQRLIEDDNGRISGYNRSGEEFDYYFKNYFWSSGDVLSGKGDKLQYEGVDMKIFIAKYGIVSLIAYFAFLFFAYSQRKSKFGFWFMLLFLMIFYKGYSMLFYSGMLMIYLMGVEWCYFDQGRKKELWPVKI